MATLIDPSVPPTSRIENAVERELARRRRMLRFYLLLLLVPLGLAAWFLAAGRTDQEVLGQAVETRIAPVEERYARIAPKLDRVESLDEALPVVEKAAEQLQAQEEKVAALQQQVQAIAPAVKEIQATQASLLRNVEPSAELQELAQRFASLEASITSIQARQIEVQRDLKAVELKIDKRPAGPAFQLDPKQLNELIDARLRVMRQSGDGTVFRKRDAAVDPPPPR